MNILVVGRGWVGVKVFSELVIRGHTVALAPHSHYVESSKNCDWVINCAGLTGVPNVDACEKEKKKTIEANAYFPVRLYEQTQSPLTRFAHFSSGCIYKGEITDVNAEPNYFGSIYSTSKAMSDSYLSDKAVVFRIRMPFTEIEENKNLLSKLTKYSKTGRIIEGGPNSITDLDEAIQVACDIIEKDLEIGPYNLVNKGAVTTKQIIDLLGLTPEWYTPEEFKLATAADRSNCTIPAYHKMRDVMEALNHRVNTFRGLE